MNQDYVRTARAKGLTERTVIMRHAIRNALIPIATIIAFDIGGLIGGAVITETIFAWKGMGRTVHPTAVEPVDLNLVMGILRRHGHPRRSSSTSSPTSCTRRSTRGSG